MSPIRPLSTFNSPNRVPDALVVSNIAVPGAVIEPKAPTAMPALSAAVKAMSMRNKDKAELPSDKRDSSLNSLFENSATQMPAEPVNADSVASRRASNSSEKKTVENRLLRNLDVSRASDFLGLQVISALKTNAAQTAAFLDESTARGWRRKDAFRYAVDSVELVTAFGAPYVPFNAYRVVVEPSEAGAPISAFIAIVRSDGQGELILQKRDRKFLNHPVIFNAAPANEQMLNPESPTNGNKLLENRVLHNLDVTRASDFKGKMLKMALKSDAEGMAAFLDKSTARRWRKGSFKYSVDSVEPVTAFGAPFLSFDAFRMVAELRETGTPVAAFIVIVRSDGQGKVVFQKRDLKSLNKPVIF